VDRSDIIGWILGIVVAGGVMAFVLIRSCSMEKDHDAWQHERAALEASISRWNALVGVDECLRYAESLPTTGIEHGAGLAIADCVGSLESLAADPAFAGDARGSLAAWADAEHATAAAAKQLTAYRDGDWREDNNASLHRLVAAVRNAHAHRTEAIAGARATIVPVVEREIRTVQREHEQRAGRDDSWWRIELAARYDRLLDDIARASREHRNPAAVMKAGARELAAAVHDAPYELRHQLNANKYLFDGTMGSETRNGYWPHPRLDEPAPFAALRKEPDLPSDPG
jgi:hypothetical protein